MKQQTASKGALMSLQEVCTTTGWAVDYVKKLRENGVLRFWKASRMGRPWFYREQIEKIVKG